jgi:hypothetical protein
VIFTEILTIIFVVLKMTEIIDWSWWLVLLPEIVAVLFYIKTAVVAIVSVKSMDRAFDRMVAKERKRMNRF